MNLCVLVSQKVYLSELTCFCFICARGLCWNALITRLILAELLARQYAAVRRIFKTSALSPYQDLMHKAKKGLMTYLIEL